LISCHCQCKRQFARSGQISEFHIFVPPNAAPPPCTVPPGSDAPLRPPPFPPPLGLDNTLQHIFIKRTTSVICADIDVECNFSLSYLYGATAYNNSCKAGALKRDGRNGLEAAVASSQLNHWLYVLPSFRHANGRN